MAKRLFYVTVQVIGRDAQATEEVSIDPDDIYQAGVDAVLRHLARVAECDAGLRTTDDLAH